MSILIIAATEMELKPPLRQLKRIKATVVHTGVGCFSAMYAIARAVQQHPPAIVIQVGIAGSLDKQYALGSVVAVAQDGFGDVGVAEQDGWKSIFDLNLVERNQKPFQEGVLPNPHKKLLRQCGLPLVYGTTVNEITTQKKHIQHLKAQGVAVESMEGAALHYVARMEKIPFLQIRGISNYVGERDKRKWKFTEAITNVNMELLRIVNSLSFI